MSENQTGLAAEAEILHAGDDAASLERRSLAAGEVLCGVICLRMATLRQ